MSQLKDSLEQLQNLYAFSKKVSIIDSARRAGALRTMILEKILEKILLHDHSILLLMDVIPKQPRELDISLIAGATRNIMESANLYFHMSQRGLDKDDIELRADILGLNGIFNEMDITKKLGFSPNCFHGQINQWFYEGARERYKNFSFFAQLSENEQTQIVSGRKAAFKMQSPRILPENMESAVYNLLSNSVHGLSLGLSSNSVNQTLYFNNFFDTKRLLMISLMVSRIYTAHVVKDYLNLRKRFYSLLTAEEKTNLKAYMSDTDLREYINDLRVVYEKDPFGNLVQSIEKQGEDGREG